MNRSVNDFKFGILIYLSIYHYSVYLCDTRFRHSSPHQAFEFFTVYRVSL